VDPTGLETREQYDQQQLAQYKQAMGAPWWENAELKEEPEKNTPEREEVKIRAMTKEEIGKLETDKWLIDKITKKDAWLYDSIRFWGLKTGSIKRDDMGGYMDPFTNEYIPLGVTQKKGIKLIADVGFALASWGVANGPRMVVGKVASVADDLAGAAGNGSDLSLRPDIALSGGRSGAGVKNLTGPANSVLKGSEGRIFITNESGQVILDVTANRAKPVTPGVGFGDKVLPTQQMLDLIKQIWEQ
jgi:hypothetical protein